MTKEEIMEALRADGIAGYHYQEPGPEANTYWIMLEHDNGHSTAIAKAFSAESAEATVCALNNEELFLDDVYGEEM